MYYCDLCLYENESKESIATHLQTIHRINETESWHLVSELKRTPIPRIRESTDPPVVFSRMIAIEIEALQGILKAAEDVLRTRQNPALLASKQTSSSVCVGCLAYYSEVSCMEKIVRRMELIENLKTICRDGNSPLPCCVATPQQLAVLEKLRNSCLQLLITLGFISLGSEQ